MTENFITIIIGYLTILIILVLKFRYKKIKFHILKPKEIEISKTALIFSIIPFLIMSHKSLTEISIITLILTTLLMFKIVNKWKT